VPQVEAPQPRPKSVSLTLERSVQHAITEPMEERLKAAGIDVRRRSPHKEGDVPAFHCNGAAIYLTDGRSATELATANNHPDTVLYDLILDHAGAKRVALARADQCSDSAWLSTVGLFQAAGFEVSRLDDVPGMAVMRTVAMLANEAADAVNQGVCSAAAVDIAMQKGVNYPKGPLAWADAVGIDHIVTVLSNLAATYGEDRYRVSPLLRRKHAVHGARFHA
ncbi:MAG TPA: 3-hydroxyacyl-CoA dehydrogenase family protein, partial [Telluria sp.]|nr:3-hydroxyacyl-CoA dehydrogenase family protein [Telluria sp.]